MLRKITALTAIAALVGSLTFSTAVEARGGGRGGGGGWHGGGGGWHGGGGGWHGGGRGWGGRGYYGRGYGYGRGWGYGGWGGYYGYGGGCWSWWYGRWVWVC